MLGIPVVPPGKIRYERFLRENGADEAFLVIVAREMYVYPIQ
jgi:hypothetical protein